MDKNPIEIRHLKKMNFTALFLVVHNRVSHLPVLQSKVVLVTRECTPFTCTSVKSWIGHQFYKFYVKIKKFLLFIDFVKV